MKKLNTFITNQYPKILLILGILIFFNTCGNPNKILTKKVDTLSQKIDSLELITVTRKDLKMEGLRSEKRMIQSTDRKILDVNRQSEIDKEISELEK
jgi:ABC-type phosphate transport system auxiliary subunit